MRMREAVTGQRLVLSYPSRTALAESTFSIPSGKVTVVIGPNGSGKSTLLSAIAGLMAPTSGTLVVAARRNDAKRISYVMQATKVNDVLPVTVREVVMMGRYTTAGRYGRLDEADRTAVAEAMKRTGITDLADRHLNQLSGGQRQRVFVAQGLAQDHDLLLLDEPLTGIDLPTAQAIDAVIHDELHRGCTVILTTHDLSEARVADHVILLAGKVVAAGPPELVLTAEHLNEAYGPALLHLGEEEVFIEDHAHVNTDSHHRHRERTIHTEHDPGELHGVD